MRNRNRDSQKIFQSKIIAKNLREIGERYLIDHLQCEKKNSRWNWNLKSLSSDEGPEKQVIQWKFCVCVSHSRAVTSPRLYFSIWICTVWRCENLNFARIHVDSFSHHLRVMWEVWFLFLLSSSVTFAIRFDFALKSWWFSYLHWLYCVFILYGAALRSSISR